MALFACIASHFSKTGQKSSHQVLKFLVTEHFRKWKVALETFKEHEAYTCHKQATIIGCNFLKTKIRYEIILNIVDLEKNKLWEMDKRLL